MNKIFIIAFFFAAYATTSFAQSKPCNAPEFRDFDFWIGNWTVHGKNEKLAGTSKISLILDSCVILEEWTSANIQNNLTYQGKSFNTYNAASKQWQQTWVDNTGNTTEFLRGAANKGQIIFYADNVPGPNGTIFMRRLTFTKTSDATVRQLGERSDDSGKTWSTEYDLEYRKN